MIEMNSLSTPTIILQHVIGKQLADRNYIVDQEIVTLFRRALSSGLHVPVTIDMDSYRISVVRLLIDAKFPEDLVLSFAKAHHIEAAAFQAFLLQYPPAVGTALNLLNHISRPITHEQIIVLGNSLRSYTEKDQISLKEAINQLSSHTPPLSRSPSLSNIYQARKGKLNSLLSSIGKTKSKLVKSVSNSDLTTKDFKNSQMLILLLESFYRGDQVAENSKTMNSICKLVDDGVTVPKEIKIKFEEKCEKGCEDNCLKHIPHEISVAVLPLLITHFPESAILKAAKDLYVTYDILKMAFKSKLPLTTILGLLDLAFFNRKQAVLLKASAENYAKNSVLTKEQFDCLISAIDLNTAPKVGEWLITERTPRV